MIQLRIGLHVEVFQPLKSLHAAIYYSPIHTLKLILKIFRAFMHEEGMQSLEMDMWHCPTSQTVGQHLVWSLFTFLNFAKI